MMLAGLTHDIQDTGNPQLDKYIVHVCVRFNNENYKLLINNIIITE